MASTFYTEYSRVNNVFSPPGGGVVGVREAVYTLTEALVVNDVIQMIPVADGERVIGLQLIVEALDAETPLVPEVPDPFEAEIPAVPPTIILAVGDGSDTDRYISGSDIGQTGGFARLGVGINTDAEVVSFNKLYTAADTIDVKVTTAPLNGAETGTIRLRAFIVRS